MSAQKPSVGGIDMAALDVKFIRESLAGKWDVAIKVNGKPAGNTIMDWPDAFGLCLGVEPGKFVPAEVSVDANVRQIAMAGWRSDVGRWFGHWYNDKGGYGELQYTYMEGDTLYGYIHEVPVEGADPIEWSVSVKVIDHDNFHYQYVGVKGTKELVAKRVK